jgi:hypothetical protein
MSNQSSPSKPNTKKYKKNALDYVNKVEESRNDPKYKTEICKTWLEKQFCPYGNKCRYAHGKKDLNAKQIEDGKYKKKDCKKFHTKGVCLYGSRCNFRHDERCIVTLERGSYYETLVKVYAENENENKQMLNVFL